MPEPMTEQRLLDLEWMWPAENWHHVAELIAEVRRLRDENERLRIWMVNRSRAILAGEPDEELV